MDQRRSPLSNIIPKNEFSISSTSIKTNKYIKIAAKDKFEISVVK
jgi:hypothetical protein